MFTRAGIWVFLYKCRRTPKFGSTCTVAAAGSAGVDSVFWSREWGADDAESDRRDVGRDEGVDAAAQGSGGDGDPAGADGGRAQAGVGCMTIEVAPLKLLGGAETGEDTRSGVASTDEAPDSVLLDAYSKAVVKTTGP